MTTFDQIISYIKSVFSSSDLNPSNVSLYGKIANSIAPIIDNTIAEQVNTQNNIQEIISLKQIGKAGYYVQQALNFQYDLVNNVGTPLVVNSLTQNNEYSVIDTTLQIIKVAIFDEPTMTLKVAYLDPTSNTLQALPVSYTANGRTVNLLQIFQNYIISVAEFAGLPTTKISLPPNIFAFQGIITYYSSFDLATLQTNVLNAIFAFRDSNPASNGILYLNDLSDYIKNNVQGIRNLAIVFPTLDGVPIVGETLLNAGYFNYPDSYDWSTNLNYVAS